MNLPIARPGQEILASDYNQLRSVVIELDRKLRSITPRPSPDIGHRTSAGGTTSFLKQQGGGGSGSTYPFQPVFYKDGETLYVRIVSSYLMLDSITVIPSFEGAPLSDPEDSEFVPPNKSLSDGEYQIWLAHSGTGAKVLIDSAPPEKDPSKAYYHLGDFEVVDSTIISQTLHPQTSLELASAPLPWTPIWFRDGEGDIKFKITKGAVRDLMLGTLTNPAFEDDYAPQADDKYYCKLTTDPNGSITQAEVLTGDEPANTQHSVVDGVDGEYNFKLFEIKGDDEDGWYVSQTLSSDIDWHTRDLKNVGGETELVNQFSSAENVNEIKSLKVADEDLTAEDGEIIVNLSITDNGDTIEHAASTVIGGVDYGTLEITKDGVKVFELGITNGLVTTMTPNPASIEVCCTTTIPV